MHGRLRPTTNAGCLSSGLGRMARPQAVLRKQNRRFKIICALEVEGPLFSTTSATERLQARFPPRTRRLRRAHGSPIRRHTAVRRWCRGHTRSPRRGRRQDRRRSDAGWLYGTGLSERVAVRGGGLGRFDADRVGGATARARPYPGPRGRVGHGPSGDLVAVGSHEHDLSPVRPCRGQACLARPLAARSAPVAARTKVAPPFARRTALTRKRRPHRSVKRSRRATAGRGRAWKDHAAALGKPAMADADTARGQLMFVQGFVLIPVFPPRPQG